jgi:electron transfer flavoprotein beta subunit
MGADRAILVETDVELQPLAVAKLLKAWSRRKARARDPRQAGDRRRRQPDGQMLAALLGLAAGDLREQGRDRRRRAKVTREIDGGLRPSRSRCRRS